jgi:hypothetical protein
VSPDAAAFSRADIEALRDELLTELVEVDWVMFGAMPAHAHDVTTIRDPAALAALVKATLAEFVDHPQAKLLDDTMSRVLTTRAELDAQLERVWPGPTALPDDDVAGWLVERDYDVTRRRAD